MGGGKAEFEGLQTFCKSKNGGGEESIVGRVHGTEEAKGTERNGNKPRGNKPEGHSLAP